MAIKSEHRSSHRLAPGAHGPSKRQLAAAAGYLAASGAYIAIGVEFTDFLFSYFVALAYLLLVAWLVPALVQRLLL